MPPVQRRQASQPSQAHSQLSLVSSQEDLFNDTIDSQSLQAPQEKGHAFDEQPYPSQRAKQVHVQMPIPPQLRHSQDDDFPASIHIPGT